MSNMLRTGAEFLSEQRHANMSETITYRRDGDSVELSATIGRAESDERAVSDFIVDAERVVFIVREEDLVLDDVQFTAKQGDEIQLGTIVYEVRRDELGQASRPVDEFSGDIRIHTVRQGVAS